MDNHTPLLNDEEKEFLEKYDKENPFLKSLSNQYKERGTLSEKQIIHLRKETQQDRKIHTRCEILHLSLNQECIFEDKDYKENKKVVVSKISEKAIQIEDKENQIFAWMPKAGVEVTNKLNELGGNNTPVLLDETPVLSLKSWFTRDGDFWKQNKPFQPIEKEEPEEELVQEEFTAVEYEEDSPFHEDDDKLPF